MADMNMIVTALEGLVPIAFMERLVAGKAYDLPTDAEREELVSVLVMADTLAAGASTPKEHKSRAKSLVALAKAITILAVAEGGVKVFGVRWRIENGALVSAPEVGA